MRQILPLLMKPSAEIELPEYHEVTRREKGELSQGRVK